MKNTLLFLALLLFASQTVFGQDLTQSPPKDTIKTIKPSVKPERRWGDAGIGIGLDYGGLFGVKATFYPIPYMGIFGAGGYELIGLGWNLGVLGRIIPANGTHVARPYLKAMYGVNAVTKVSGKSGYDKMFFGFTVGLGLELRFGKRKQSGLNFDLNVPFRTPDYFEQISRMKADPQIKMSSSTIPIAFSFGYNFEF